MYPVRLASTRISTGYAQKPSRSLMWYVDRWMLGWMELLGGRGNGQD